MTDSHDLRREAQHAYGETKVITHFGTVNYFGNLKKQGMTSVLGEQWLGTLCDAFVISNSSGLGLQASMRSVAWERGNNSQPVVYFGNQCVRVNHIDKLMTFFSGI